MPISQPNFDGQSDSILNRQSINQDQARRVLAAIAADTELKRAIVQSIYEGELDGLNDSLRPYRRKTHRGKRAEEQAVSKLGVALESLGFQCEDADGQFRFINLERFDTPICFIITRANEVNGEFKTWKKGARSEELMNENRDQLVLLEFAVTRSADGSTRHSAEIDARILNVWVIADASSEANSEEDGLRIHVIVPIGIERRKGVDWVAKRTLRTLLKTLIWEGALGAPMLAPADLPEATPIVITPPLERREGGEQPAA